ncbi:MarR family winged helix-turn-helix transcriptional regulator [Neobacillus mesonae]|uniref:MarR family transcriptional regulator n=1 Tax=Neobacillus mesonae TaxID=1193713 RepID=A0A3Q9QV34_9BACI|nr:MarR family transcriptional regulator [Neobacillus mesonae]AZU62264.1 MarR family transcriptional regulator [Neobacillus mesonae]MED4205484.1 MarR family transcriptional regulator [Neobacillus mesonae]
MRNAYNSEILNSFSDINKLLYKVSKMDADRNGLTVVQLKALYKISAQPNMGLVELAEHLKLTNSTVSGVVDRLVQNGLIERHTLPHDRRAITIRLSQKGEEKLEHIVLNESLLVQKLNKIKQLPAEDIENLLRIHKKVQSILSE